MTFTGGPRTIIKLSSSRSSDYHFHMPFLLLSLSSTGSSQTGCMDTFNISASFGVITVEGGVRTCFRCWFNGAVKPSTSWTLNAVLIPASDGTVTDGVLTIFDPATVVPGIQPNIQLTCRASPLQYRLDNTNLGCAYSLLPRPSHAVVSCSMNLVLQATKLPRPGNEHVCVCMLV